MFSPSQVYIWSCHVSYQTEGKVEQSGATVEQDSEKSGCRGDEEADIPAHYHPQRLHDLRKQQGHSKLSLKYDLTLRQTNDVAPAGFLGKVFSNDYM